MGVTRSTPRGIRLRHTGRMDVAITLRALDAFAVSAAALADQLAAESPSRDALREESRALVQAALPLLDAVTLHAPDCAAHFTLLADAARLLDALPPAALERAWEHDGSMPAPTALCESAQNLLKAPARVASRIRFEQDSDAAVLRSLLIPLEEALPTLHALLASEHAR